MCALSAHVIVWTLQDREYLRVSPVPMQIIRCLMFRRTHFVVDVSILPIVRGS